MERNLNRKSTTAAGSQGGCRGDEHESPKKNSPTIFRKLMCFVRQPSQREQQQERLSEHASSDVLRRAETSTARQESRGAYEEFDPSRRISSNWNPNTMPTKHELSVVQQRMSEAQLDDSRRPGSSYADYFRSLRLNPGSCLGSQLSSWKGLGFRKRGGSSRALQQAAPSDSGLPLEPQSSSAVVRRKSMYISSEERTLHDLLTTDLASIAAGRSFPKRFTERRSTTSGYQDLELVRKRVLGEMLAMPHPDSRSRGDSRLASPGSGSVPPPCSGSDVECSSSSSRHARSRSRHPSPSRLAAEGDAGAQHRASPYGSSWWQLGESSDEAAVYDQVDSHPQNLLNKSTYEDLSSSQHLDINEAIASGSSEVVDHASPFLVSSASIADALSSSRRINRLDVELDELRMQLHLLKMDSALLGEAFTLFPTEDDTLEVSSLISEGSHIFGSQGWEVFYALDMLIQSGLRLSAFDIFRTTWHSPDSPLSHRLFSSLERRYDDEMFGVRPERKLLFDRVNAALLDVFRQHADSHPWVMPELMGQHSTWETGRAMEALAGLISHEAGKGRVLERAMDKEMEWWDCKGEVDEIGKEIEEYVINGLIVEFFL